MDSTADIRTKIHQMYSIEQLSGGHSVIHRMHPAAKLLSMAVLIITVVSFDRYAFGRLIPYIFYPVILMALSETPYGLMLKRALVALPFCLFAGLSNVFFDRSIAFAIGDFGVSYGVVSLFTVLFRAYICVMAVLLLVATTPFGELTALLRRLRVPDIFVTMFEMTYRYIGVLLEEVTSMRMAYILRGSDKNAIAFAHMGSFVGQLLLRSFDRAERVYNAMKCRGYALRRVPTDGKKLQFTDMVFLFIAIGGCVLLRIFDFGALLGGMF